MTSTRGEESRASTSEPATRVLIVDDHPMVRAGLRALLDVPDINIVGEATSGPRAVDVAAETQPDVVLMDVRMPDGNGLEATRAVRAVSPASRVLIVTSFADEDYLRSAIAAGADGFILKQASRALLLDSIRMVRAGGGSFPPEMVAGLSARPSPAAHADESEPPPIQIGRLRIDAARHLALSGGERLVLTFLEFRALVILAEAGGNVVTYDRLQSELWPGSPSDEGESHRVVSLIARLRSHLGESRGYLQTVKRVGYRIAEPR